MRTSKIEWTESTWNPVTGCTKLSAGCANCYAERMARRLRAMGQPNYRRGFKVTCHEHVLNQPVTWKKPRTVFVNSMGDLFHEEVPREFIDSVFDVMKRAHWHRFQVLTKRAERMAELAPHLPWADNIWMGVTVEDGAAKSRMEALREVPAFIRFLSVEPLLESLGTLDLRGIHWVIVGGESGPGSRPMQPAWVHEIREQCEAADIPSSSSNGEASTRRRQAAYWMAGYGMISPRVNRAIHRQTHRETGLDAAGATTHPQGPGVLSLLVKPLRLTVFPPLGRSWSSAPGSSPWRHRARRCDRSDPASGTRGGRWPGWWWCRSAARRARR